MALTKFSNITFLLIICLGLCQTFEHKVPNGGKLWAFLVAGSKDFFNYRHQADLCHAYQILHANGIPDENIIVMMYDDIAYSANNPNPGEIINEPNGTNVYKGVPKDYVGKDVNSTNFLKVLSGDSKGMKGIGSGRVIKSGPNDHIFVNFVDHGAPGLLAFPSEELYAIDLKKTLTYMSTNQQFARMVIYVEACESGSMFDAILPDDDNIFVLTAADPKESSYACFYDDDLGTYLADVFSYNWMHDSEHEVVLAETLHHQFEKVRSETNTSHVEEYGDLDVGSMHVSDFIGFKIANRNANIKIAPAKSPLEDAVPSHHVPIAIIHKKLEVAVDPKEKEELSRELHIMLEKRKHLEEITESVLANITAGKPEMLVQLKYTKHGLTLKNFDCYKRLASYFSETCFKFSDNPHALRQLYLLVNVCEERFVEESVVMSAMDNECKSKSLMKGIL